MHRCCALVPDSSSYWSVPSQHEALSEFFLTSSEDFSVEIIGNPKSGISKGIKLCLEFDSPVFRSTKQDTNDACYFEVVTSGDLTAITFVKQDEVCVLLKSVCDCCGLSSVQFPTNLNVQIRPLNRDKHQSPLRSELVEPHEAFLTICKFVPDLLGDMNCLKLDIEKIKAVDESEV